MPSWSFPKLKEFCKIYLPSFERHPLYNIGTGGALMFKHKFHIQQGVDCPGIFRKLLLAWLVAVTVEYVLLPKDIRNLAEIEGLSQMSIVRVGCIALGMMILLLCLSRLGSCARIERIGIAVTFAGLATTTLFSSFTWPFLVACVLVFAVLVVFAIFGRARTLEPTVTTARASKFSLWFTIGLSVAFFLFVCAWSVGRVYSFSTPTYDFGIFSQMFHNMKEGGLPLTTLERDGLLSHFAVHVSPVYYLLLPFYWLFPTPATLQILQAAVITSAVIPLWLIGKHHGLSGAQRMLICAILLLYPAFSGGTSYDIHENCFLTPLLLWVLYGIDRKNTAIIVIATILTLSVKEDAAVYIAVIALWLIVKTLVSNRKGAAYSLLMGIGMLCASLLWFFSATRYLAESGDGVMTYRYENFLYNGSSSLATVIQVVLLSPMKAVYECVDSDKLRFIALTLLPLLVLPLITRRYERYILLIPYLLINLMSDYPYQHDIFFQYSFGTTALLIYLTVVNLANLKIRPLRWVALIGSAVVCAVCFGFVIAPTAIYYPVQAIRNYNHYQTIRDTLDSIPEDASVTATTFYTTHLSRREALYDIYYCSEEHLLDSDYIVLNPCAGDEYALYATEGKEDGFEQLVRLLEKNGYEEYKSVENALVIYRSNLSSD